jgi:hypothetical protein
MKRNLVKRTHRDDVRSWSRHDGRHALDGYLEDVMAVHAQSGDPAADRSVRMFANHETRQLMVISTSRATLEETARALQDGYSVVAKVAKRPDEATLERLLRDAPFSRVGLPPPRKGPRALPARRDDHEDEE